MKNTYMKKTSIAVLLVTGVMAGPAAYAVVSPSIYERERNVGWKESESGFYNWKCALPTANFTEAKTGATRNEILDDLIKKLEHNLEESSKLLAEAKEEIKDLNLR